MSRGVCLSDSALAPELVYDLASILKLSDRAFIVGGQALNLWAERYSDVGELAAYGPYTSKDLDYFGYRQAAEKLASALNGTVSLPAGDNHTPQTAIVKAVVDEQNVEIDFLYHVKGVRSASLEKQAVEIVLTVRVGGKVGDLHVPVMHPLHCLQSRLANVIELGRRTDLAKRQLEASSIVLREFLSERLADSGHKHVVGVLQALHDYLLTDATGKKAHREMENDPAAILDFFQDDDRLDDRWRQMSLRSMREKIADRRTAWGMMRARIRQVFGQTT